MEHGERILQICHSDGVVKIDEIQKKEEGLQIEGVLEVRLLYMTTDDTEPVKSSVEVVPFHYMTEVPGIQEDSVYQLNTGVEQLTGSYAGR